MVSDKLSGMHSILVWFLR